MLSIEEADYDWVLGVNLKGTFNICKSVLRIFTKKESGVIVNLASVAAQRGGGLVGGAHYAASKGGVVSLTQTIAREFGPSGVRANVVCPSMVETGCSTASRARNSTRSSPAFRCSGRGNRRMSRARACSWPRIFGLRHRRDDRREWRQPYSLNPAASRSRSVNSVRRVGKGALAPCPPSIADRAA